MLPEVATLMQFIERIAHDIRIEIDGTPDDVLNAPPPLPTMNTLYALGTHLVGMGEFWVLQLVGGEPHDRDRAAEFHATGSRAALLQRLDRWVADCQRVLATLPPAALDAHTAPPAEFRDSGGFDSALLTKRQCLLHVIEHSALHLGHLQITRQLLLRV